MTFRTSPLRFLFLSGPKILLDFSKVDMSADVVEVLLCSRSPYQWRYLEVNFSNFRLCQKGLDIKEIQKIPKYSLLKQSDQD